MTLKYHNQFQHQNPFSHVVLDHEFAYLSGQIAFDREKKQIVNASFAEETRMAMTQIKNLLAEIGLEMKNIVRGTVYLTDVSPESVAEVNRVYAQFFPDGRFPARSCVAVAKLIGNAKVEIEVTARIPKANM
ncbi:hypothetical protein HK101_003947 [Irineochytrium annulatum]|nr:hypothetical protein HK101_003947 [Irineochytrium annulatum]